MLRELFATDIQRIECICAVSTMLQQVLFGLRLLLHRLVLVEAVASTFDTGRLNGQNEVIIVLAVEERHQALLASKAPVDEQVLLIMAHRVAKVHILYLPPVALKLMDYHIAEILVIDGIVRAKRCRVVIENHRLVLMISVVRAEIIHQGGDFSFELDVEGL